MTHQNMKTARRWGTLSFTLDCTELSPPRLRAGRLGAHRDGDRLRLGVLAGVQQAFERLEDLAHTFNQIVKHVALLLAGSHSPTPS